MYIYIYNTDASMRKSKIHLLLHKWPALRAREDSEDDARVPNRKKECSLNLLLGTRLLIILLSEIHLPLAS